MKNCCRFDAQMKQYLLDFELPFDVFRLLVSDEDSRISFEESQIFPQRKKKECLAL